MQPRGALCPEPRREARLYPARRRGARENNQRGFRPCWRSAAQVRPGPHRKNTRVAAAT
jgi:hypothetical protein